MGILDNIDTSSFSSDEKESLWWFKQLRDAIRRKHANDEAAAQAELEMAVDSLSFLSPGDKEDLKNS